MGSQQSSRRISIDNEDTNNVIRVSEKVVERLKGSVDESTKQSVPPNPPPRSFNPVQVHPQKLPIPAQNPSVSSYNAAATPVNPVTTTTALDIRKQYEEELRKNNEYWQTRIKDIEENHDRINYIWENEYKKAIEDAENNPMIPSIDRETLPCTSSKVVVIECYKKNKDRPLLCTNEVQAFSDCVNSIRFRKAAASV